MTSGYLPGIIGARDLVAELASMATEPGAKTGVWPEGRKAVTVGGETRTPCTATWTRNARNPLREPEWAIVQQEAGISAGSCHADAMAQ